MVELSVCVVLVKGFPDMKAMKIISLAVVQLALLIPCVFGQGADGLPIFEYKGTVKYYDEDLGKLAPDTYQIYMIFDEEASYGVWYGGTGSYKWFFVDMDLSADLYSLDEKGNIAFMFGGTDFGFGKITFNKKDGSISSSSATGTIADLDLFETGTFSLRYNSTLTKKAITSNMTALDRVIADLIAKKYVLSE